ncbi:MAG TPA: GDSL-type esterase/lipase family protein [Pseudonocardiaceae bacterium]
MRSDRLPWTRTRVALAVAVLVVLFGAVADLIVPGPAPAPPKPGPPHGPLTIVSLGDSSLSGEGTGDYTVATNGQGGDWCHRSPNAEIDHTHVAGVVRTVNLACSGASTTQVGPGDARQYGESSQTEQLAKLAKHDRVVAVVVAVGANDDPHFAQLLNNCVQAWARQGSCSAGFEPQWQRRVNAMVPKVTKLLGEIRAAMAALHYAPGTYQLVLQSYAAPVGPNAVGNLLSLAGCPFRPVDLNWVRNTGIHALDNGLREAADKAKARYLDLADAGLGHEACSGGRDTRNEWFSRLTVAWQDITDRQRVGHALQASFHPNARGAAAFADCLGQFLATTDRAAACLAGPGGQLHPAAIVTTTG